MMNGMRGLASIFVACALASVAAPAKAQQVVPSATPDVSIVARGSVYAIAKDPSGGTIIGGLFTGVAGVPRSNLARLAPDGSVDPAWAPSVHGAVRSIAVDASGNVFVAGDVTSIDGVQRSRLAKIRPSGAVDPDWAPSVSGQKVRGVAVDGRGGLIVVGSFSAIDLFTRYNVARLDAEGAGALDLSWAPEVSGASAVVVGSDGTAFVAASVGEPAQGMRRIARITTQGTVDADWGPSMNDPVQSLALGADGRLYAGGGFTSVDGLSRSRLLRMSATGGEVDPEWVPSVPGTPNAIAVAGDGTVHAAGRGFLATLDGSIGSSPSGSTALPGEVFALLPDDTGTVLAGGDFFTLAGHTRLGLARLAGGMLLDGSPDVTSPGSVNALLAAPDGSTYIGGFFHKVAGEPRHHAARLDAGGRLDPQWRPSFNDTVNLLAHAPGGGIYAAGYFVRVGDVERWRIARLDGDGVVDASWRADISGTPYALAVGQEGGVFVGGQLYAVQGIPRRFLAKVSGASGTLDLEWDPAPNDLVTHLAAHGESVYAAGYFEPRDEENPVSIGGQPRSRIAKLHASGAGEAHVDWHPGFSTFIHALAVDPTGRLHVGTGDGPSASGVVRISDAPGAPIDAAWPEQPFFRSVDALAFDTSGALHVLGVPTGSPVGLSQFVLARMAADSGGVVDAGWRITSDDRIWALDTDSAGGLWVGGQFSLIGGEHRDGLARFSGKLFADGFDGP